MIHSANLHPEDVGKNVRSTGSPGSTAALKFEVDVEKYQAMIDDVSLSDDERREFILAIWSFLMIAITLGGDLVPGKTRN